MNGKGFNVRKNDWFEVLCGRVWHKCWNWPDFPSHWLVTRSKSMIVPRRKDARNPRRRNRMSETGIREINKAEKGIETSGWIKEAK